MNPQYHPDANALSFNVKTLGLRWPEGGTDAQREAAWEFAQRDWWRDAELLAAKHGFTDVHVYGRSGGWLTPVPEVRDDDCSADDLARIRAFGDELADLFNQAPEYFNHALTDVLEADAEADREHQLHQRNAERYGRGVAMLAQLARDVIACDTTSEFIAQRAMEALALLEPET